MKKILWIPLFLFSCYANAGWLAVGGTNITPEGYGFAYCIENGTWDNTCTIAQNIPNQPYENLFKASNETIAISSGGYMYHLKAACKSNNETIWRDCSPDENVIRYAGFWKTVSDGNGSLISVACDFEDFIVASCRDPAGKWSDCSPNLVKVPGGWPIVGYGNGNWMVFTSEKNWANNQTIYSAFCMDSTNTKHIWKKCDAAIFDPEQSFFNENVYIDQVQYVASEKQWVVTGSGLEDENGWKFKSICRKDSESDWKDCTGPNPYWLDDSLKLVQNDHGELVAMNHASAPDVNSFPHRHTQLLCKKPGADWIDCSGSLSKKGYKYEDILFSDGKWVLIGNHYAKYSDDSWEYYNSAYIHAIQSGDDWIVSEQKPENDFSFLHGIVELD